MGTEGYALAMACALASPVSAAPTHVTSGTVIPRYFGDAALNTSTLGQTSGGLTFDDWILPTWRGARISTVIIVNDNEPAAATTNATAPVSSPVNAGGAADGLLADISALKSLPDNWDGDGAARPHADAIKDANTVAQFWPADLGIPVVDADFEGRVTLDWISSNGLSLGGISFSGSGNIAHYTLVDGVKVVKTGKFDAKSPTDIMRSLSEIAQTLA